MKPSLQKLLPRLLRQAADDIDAGNTHLSEQEILDLASMFSHKQLSKDQACTYLNLSRSRFDDLVRDGKIPRGRKIRGHKELYWFEDELFLCKE